MKRTSLKRIGKHGRINIEANKKLKEVYNEKGITKCEIGLEGCLRNWTLGFAHKHRRYWYYSHEGLDSYEETIMACTNCHNKIDINKELLESVFKRLRENNGKNLPHL